MNSYNVYEKLYNNTKAVLSIEKNNQEYTLGEYMLMKAAKKNGTSLSALKNVGNGTGKAVSAFLGYVNEKLTVKNPPAKDKTIIRFPMRTSAAAFLSAMMICGLALSFGLFSGKNFTASTPSAAETEMSDYSEENLAEVPNN